MDLATKKKNLLGIWMLTHQNLNPILRREFLENPITQQILEYDIKFAYYAIEQEKKMLLSEILEIVLEIEQKRIKMMAEKYGHEKVQLAEVRFITNSSITNVQCIAA